MDQQLDVICLGRSSVDLYGAEMGADIKDVDMFRKAVGGCPTNIAIGTARLGLKSALITRVGREQLGDFVREQLVREKVNTEGVVVDPQRFTALVFLGVVDRHTAPHIFYRENCADMALSEGDIDPSFIARARALVVTGTHFSTETVAKASWKAIGAAKGAGVKVVFDIDFRPSLWRLAGVEDGAARLALSPTVRDALLAVIAESDVVVGTEEEFCSATAQQNIEDALESVRATSNAVLVCKRGAEGCDVFPGGRAGTLEEPVRGNGFRVEVLNTVGAGDAFMSGFLRGWLGGTSWETAATYANACGAIAVTRLLCSSEYPTWQELTAFTDQYPSRPAAEIAGTIAHIHRATTRGNAIEDLFVLACDHRTQFVEITDRLGLSTERLPQFKRLAVAAASNVRSRGVNAGVICDDEFGSEALFDAAKTDLWFARPIEVAGSKPIEFVIGHDVGSGLIVWPKKEVVKCLCHFDLDDPEPVRTAQEEQLKKVWQACFRLDREFLLEIIPSGKYQDRGTAAVDVIRHLYRIGIRPDWWKLEPFGEPEVWKQVTEAITANDPFCRGVLILGLTSTPETLQRSFGAAADFSIVRGFAVGRAIVAGPIEAWLKEEISDAEAQAQMEATFESLIENWRKQRATTVDATSRSA
jgi:5-dehydro-2-deoxygluconokinase